MSHAVNPQSNPPSHRGRIGRRCWLPWLGVLTLCAGLIHALGDVPVLGHDTVLHFYRIPALNALWRQGIFFARWLPDLAQGYGYPLFQFYPPLGAYSMTLAYWLVGQNAPLAMNLTFAVALAITAIGMFLLGRELFGDLGGLLASAAYTLAPHVLYQTFQRASISNALAMAFYPWATWTLLRVAKAPSARRIAAAALALAAVMISHVSAAVLLIAPLVMIGALACLLEGRSAAELRSRLGATALALGLGLAISAFCWLPALTEIQYTRYATSIAQEDEDFRRHFADVWRWASAPVAEVANPALPTTTGLGQLALAGMALVASAASLMRKNAVACLRRANWLTGLLALVGLGAVFLATPPSTWLWEHIPLLRTFQYPWRWLDLAVFPVALACGRLGLARQKHLRLALAALGLLTFFLASLPHLYPPRWRGLPGQPDLAQVSQVQREFGVYGLTSWGEYMPASVPTPPEQPPFVGADLGARLDQKLRRDGLPSDALLHASGSPLRATVQLDLREPAELVFYTHYFPGWRAKIDGRRADIGPDPAGNLGLHVPAGQHTVEVYWGKTTLRWISDAASCAALLVVVLALALLGRLTRRLWRARAQERRENRSPTNATHTPVQTGMLIALLLALFLLKGLYLDRHGSPLVRHVRDGRLPGASAPSWRTYGNALILLGYELDGSRELTLYWQVQRPLNVDYAVEVTLVDLLGAPLKTIHHTHPGYNLMSRWEAGQLVRDEYALALEEAPAPIVYRLMVTVRDPSTGERLPVSDAPTSSVYDNPIASLALPSAERRDAPRGQPSEALFGQVIALESAEFPAEVAAGQPFEYTLQWRARAGPAADYTVFVHLLNPDGSLAADNDGPPRRGLYPTSFWSPGEGVADERTWTLSVPAGEYWVEVGLYHPASGERLPLEAGQYPDRVRLGRLRVIGPE